MSGHRINDISMIRVEGLINEVIEKGWCIVIKGLQTEEIYGSYKHKH